MIAFLDVLDESRRICRDYAPPALLPRHHALTDILESRVARQVDHLVLGVRRAMLSALLNGRAALSPEMTLRIEKAFDVSLDMLLRMQAWRDASQMRARAREINVQRYEPA